MSHRKKFTNLGDLPFFNVNAGYVKMDASEALSVLEDNLRGSPEGYLSPECYSALCSLANIILVQEKRVIKLAKKLDALIERR